MRRIDTTHMTLVHYGKEWHFSAPPCKREMVMKLEQNEAFVYWLQPPGGDVSTQIPAMKLEDGFYSLSLRMMKAIWRHVRLKKDFINVERAQMGGLKLRIPSMLLNEKIRTKTRFNAIRMQGSASRESDTTHPSAACKITKVMKEVFLPMMDMRVPAFTDFSSDSTEDEGCVVRSLIELFPSEDQDRAGFIRRVTKLYDEHAAGEGGVRKKMKHSVV